MTQAFFNPDNPEIRTRETHTNEVCEVAKFISYNLGLNTSLVGAGAMGHDLGHGPGSHTMEQALGELGVRFRHERFGPIIASFIEREGDGLHLSQTTLRVMYEHRRDGKLVVDETISQESSLVMFADKIASIIGDISDLQTMERLSQKHCDFINALLPGEHQDRLNQCINGLIRESCDAGRVSFSESETAKNFSQVRKLIVNEYHDSFTLRSLVEGIKMVYDDMDKIFQLQNYDKTILIALMTDAEFTEVSNISYQRRLTFDDLYDFGLFRIISEGFLEKQTYNNLDRQIHELVYQ